MDFLGRRFIRLLVDERLIKYQSEWIKNQGLLFFGFNFQGCYIIVISIPRGFLRIVVCDIFAVVQWIWFLSGRLIKLWPCQPQEMLLEMLPKTITRLSPSLLTIAEIEERKELNINLITSSMQSSIKCLIKFTTSTQPWIIQWIIKLNLYKLKINLINW